MTTVEMILRIQRAYARGYEHGYFGLLLVGDFYRGQEHAQYMRGVNAGCIARQEGWDFDD